MTATEHVKQPRWSVGALAKVTGLTVRTLHHYDELGLLRPSERTPSGHRRYTEPDLQRLYRIRLLRQLGMSLDEIGEALADPAGLREVLTAHLEQLDDQVWRLETLRRQTRGLLDQLDGPRPDPGALLALLGSTTVFDDSLSRDQRQHLFDLADRLTDDERRHLDAEWPKVLSAIIAHYRAATPVEDPEVQAEGRRLAKIGRMFAGDDPDLLKSMSTFFREHGHGVLREVLPGQSLSDLGDGLWDYVGRMYAASR